MENKLDKRDVRKKTEINLMRVYDKHFEQNQRFRL